MGRNWYLLTSAASRVDIELEGPEVPLVLAGYGGAHSYSLRVGLWKR